jgi:hypothetical protein
MAVRSSAPRTGRALLPKNIIFYVSGTHFCWRLSKCQGLVRPEGLGTFKISYKKLPDTFWALPRLILDPEDVDMFSSETLAHIRTTRRYFEENCNFQ